MKFAISTGILILAILALGATASTYGAQDKGQDGHSQGDQQQSKPAKPSQQQHTQQAAKPSQQQRAQQQQAKPAQQQQSRGAQPQHAQQARTPQQHSQQASRSQQPQTHAVNRTQQGNDGRNASPTQQPQGNGGNQGNYAHGRISDDHYAANFGSEHRFHVNRREYDSRRFQYGGYSFGFVDPWPGDWGYDDDVYVVYVDDGYYMYDRVHPGVRISINIF